MPILTSLTLTNTSEVEVFAQLRVQEEATTD
jgi:hypothetical protein